MNEAKSRYSGQDFYQVLRVKRDAPLKDIQRAYRALALKVHPDRNGNSPESTRDFQELSRMMEILSDPIRRADYDTLGDVDVEFGSNCGPEHWRSVFRKVTREDIDAYEAQYIGSNEEETDVLHFYDEFKGDMSKMLEWIPLSDPSYLKRYEQIISAAVLAGKTVFYPKWKEAKRAADKHRDKYAGEEKMAQQMLQTIAQKYTPFLPAPSEQNDPSSSDKDEKKAPTTLVARDAEQVGVLRAMGTGLVASMRAREIARHLAMVKSLEAKYGNKKRKKSGSSGAGKRKRKENEPSEEEFQRIQKRLDRQRMKNQNR